METRPQPGSPSAVSVRSRKLPWRGAPLLPAQLLHSKIRRDLHERLHSQGHGCPALVPALAFSQTYQGGVRGAVRDADGGVLPGTTVTLTNAQTGAVRTSVTNERGEYVFASVAPGTYNLGVELSGFAPFQREALEVGVQTFLVQDVSLQVGGIAESVTVTGETPLIETANASMASAIDKAQMDVLPTPGRNVYIFAVTTPNVVHAGDRCSSECRIQVERLLALPRRRTASRKQLHPGRRVHHRHAEPRHHQPQHGSSAGNEGANHHLRRGDGADRRRCLQRHP